jgi:ATP-binding cassette subfamily F protein uup
VFLVSHDRTFLDNVVTSTIAFEGDGLWREYEGGVQDWLVQSRRSREMTATSAPATKLANTASGSKTSPTPATDTKTPTSKRKLSYKEQRELDQLPGTIAELEAEQKSIQELLADGSLYSSDGARAAALHVREGEIEIVLMQALERWAQLAD